MRLRVYSKFYFSAFIILGLFSCKVVSDNQQLKVASTQGDTITIPKIGVADCIFDQRTQTDDFLKEIKELDDYVWDSRSKSACVFLEEKIKLIITRGGCDHFELVATFKRSGKFDFDQEKDFVFNKMIWITSLLDEFEGDVIKNVIESDRVSITRESETYLYGNFMNEKVYESYYMDYRIENDSTSFSISYYLN